MEYDFSGYATKNGLKCSDGRTIMHGAFKENDGQIVPLVWQHIHNDPGNVLGQALLEHRDDGVYSYCSFNDTEAGRTAKELVKHGDVKSLSIYANQLKQRGGDVLHGMIREVSLVLNGANPGALIDNVTIRHGDGSYDTIDDEAIIFTDNSELEIEHADGGKPMSNNAPEAPAASNSGDQTVEDIFNGFTDDEKNVVYFLIGQALNDAGVSHSDEDGEDFNEIQHSGMEDGVTARNVFEGYTETEGPTLSHAQIDEILNDAKKIGSLKDSFLAHAQTYGIENIDILFPDAKTINNTPEFISRRMEWVNAVLSGTNHSPFTRIKSVQADITADEARALGYVKGNRKKDEVIKLLKRTTTPTTIYKKQKLDRDDIIDITDFDVVAWLKAEMRVMLDEEVARAVLVGDGRPLTKSDGSINEDKIDEEHLRPILTEDEMYCTHLQLTSDKALDIVDALARAKKDYRGSGSPTLYIASDNLTSLLLTRDPNTTQKYWKTPADLASEIGVSNIVEVPVLEGVQRTDNDNKKFDLWGIIVNLKDYTIGADKGGQVSMFDDFDIDYNQNKYLIETRLSGCLTKLKSAVVVEKPVSGSTTTTTPAAPKSGN